MENIKYREAKEIASRCVILNELLFVVHGGSTSEATIELLNSLDLMNFISGEEKIFLSKEDHSQVELDNMSWKRESLITLLWTLGEVNALSDPCDEGEIPNEIFLKLEQNPLLFINEATLRTENEIFEATEDIYEIHWLVRDAMINKREIPDNYDPNVVYYRHHALCWVENSSEADWDNVSVDT